MQLEANVRLAKVADERGKFVCFLCELLIVCDLAANPALHSIANLAAAVKLAPLTKAPVAALEATDFCLGLVSIWRFSETRKKFVLEVPPGRRLGQKFFMHVAGGDYHVRLLLSSPKFSTSDDRFPRLAEDFSRKNRRLSGARSLAFRFESRRIRWAVLFGLTVPERKREGGREGEPEVA